MAVGYGTAVGLYYSTVWSVEGTGGRWWLIFPHYWTATLQLPQVAIPDDRPRRIKAVITRQRRGLTTKKQKSQDSLGNSLSFKPRNKQIG